MASLCRTLLRSKLCKTVLPWGTFIKKRIFNFYIVLQVRIFVGVSTWIYHPHASQELFITNFQEGYICSNEKRNLKKVHFMIINENFFTKKKSVNWGEFPLKCTELSVLHQDWCFFLELLEFCTKSTHTDSNLIRNTVVLMVASTFDRFLSRNSPQSRLSPMARDNASPSPRGL